MTPDETRLRRATVAVAACWAVVVVAVAVASLPESPVRLPGASGGVLRTVVPEGWAFFTRSPRAPELVPYAADADGRWRAVSLGPNARPRNAFGVSRAARAQGYEVGELVTRVPSGAWRSCPGDVAVCLARAPAHEVRTPVRRPTLCGAIGVVSAEPAPWAWAGDVDRPLTAPAVVRLDVRC